jgi:hypothetical protein
MALTAMPRSCANRPSFPFGIRGSDVRARDSSVAAALPRDRSRNPSPICRCFWLDQHATESISTKPLPRVLLQFGLESAYFFLDSFWNPLLLLNETEHGHIRREGSQVQKPKVLRMKAHIEQLSWTPTPIRWFPSLAFTGTRSFGCHRLGQSGGQTLAMAGL